MPSATKYGGEYSHTYIDDLPEEKQGRIEKELMELLSDLEVEGHYDGPNSLEADLERGMHSRVIDLEDSIPKAVMNSILFDKEESTKNILYIDFSQSGARYFATGIFKGEPFSFEFGGIGEHALEMIWNVLEELGVQDYSIYDFDEIYIDGIYQNREALQEDYYDEEDYASSKP